MPDYRRAYVPGGTYFFTVALLERRLRLLTANIDALREAFRIVKDERPFGIEAIIILPEHLHCMWTLPPGDMDFSSRWRLIKSRFSRSLATGERLSERRRLKRERGIWQRRFWEHAIRDQQDFDAHFDYIPQPHQAWLGPAGCRLALFEFPPVCSVRGVSLGLGRPDGY